MPGSNFSREVSRHHMKTKLPPCIKVGALNCQGLKEKIDYPEVQNLISSCDIFGVTETWYGENDEGYVEGYEYFPFNRGNEKGAPRGGIGVFIKNNLRST